MDCKISQFLIALLYQQIYLYIYVKSLNSRFEIDFLEDATEIFRAIAHPIRITIIDLLKDNIKLSVTEIHRELGIEQAIASHHLRILKDKKILIADRDGKNTFYSLKSPYYTEIIHSMESLFPNVK